MHAPRETCCCDSSVCGGVCGLGGGDGGAGTPEEGRDWGGGSGHGDRGCADAGIRRLWVWPTVPARDMVGLQVHGHVTMIRWARKRTTCSCFG
eukprot:scaffold13521_cov19-Tisochrysis_lutea.AAC.1